MVFFDQEQLHASGFLTFSRVNIRGNSVVFNILKLAILNMHEENLYEQELEQHGYLC